MAARTQAARTAETTEKLIGATLALIAERGVDGFSIADVADRAGVSRGLPGHHFKSRDGLVLAAAQQAMRVVRRHADQGLEPLIGSLSRSLDRARAPTVALRALASLATAESLPKQVDNHVRSFWAAAADMLRGHVEAAVEQGSVPKSVDPAAVSRVLAAALMGQAVLATRAGAQGLTGAEAEAFLRLVVGGLTSDRMKVSKPKRAHKQRQLGPNAQQDMFAAAEGTLPEPCRGDSSPAPSQVAEDQALTHGTSRIG